MTEQNKTPEMPSREYLYHAALSTQTQIREVGYGRFFSDRLHIGPSPGLYRLDEPKPASVHAAQAIHGRLLPAVSVVINKDSIQRPDENGYFSPAIPESYPTQTTDLEVHQPLLAGTRRIELVQGRVVAQTLAWDSRIRKMRWSAPRRTTRQDLHDAILHLRTEAARLESEGLIPPEPIWKQALGLWAIGLARLLNEFKLS